MLRYRANIHVDYCYSAKIKPFYGHSAKVYTLEIIPAIRYMAMQSFGVYYCIQVQGFKVQSISIVVSSNTIIIMYRIYS